MIGFSFPVKIYDENGELSHETALLSLDLDAVSDEGRPGLDIRLAKDDSVIVTADVQDVSAAMREIDYQFKDWVAANRQEQNA